MGRGRDILPEVSTLPVWLGHDKSFYVVLTTDPTVLVSITHYDILYSLFGNECGFGSAMLWNGFVSTFCCSFIKVCRGKLCPLKFL